MNQVAQASSWASLTEFKMEIDCEFLEYFWGYRSRVTRAAITKPNVDIAIKGKHQPSKSNDDVAGVNFFNARVEFFPRNLQMTFPNMKILRIEGCGLKEIRREDLIGLEKLELLDLNHNQLTSLPDDLFSNMPSLKRVFLARNKIEFASSKLIEPIIGNQLESFYLTGNANIDEYYSRGAGTIQEFMAKIDENCKPPQPIAKPPATERQFLRSFHTFRQLGRFSDFVIVVGSKEFPVHRNVLATQSPMFAVMFKFKKNGRTASKLKISDLSAEAVEAFLDFLYERKMPDAQYAVEIFMLAAKYEVAELKIICEKIIREHLDESNAFEIFKLACGPHKSEELKISAFEKLQEKFGGELHADLMNNPEKLQKIVEAKKVLDELMNTG